MAFLLKSEQFYSEVRASFYGDADIYHHCLDRIRGVVLKRKKLQVLEAFG